MAKGNDELREASELKKARGETDSQKEVHDYHAGDFQTTDPVTGEPRGKTMNWEDEDHPSGLPLGEERTPEELEAEQEAERERSATSSAATPTARKSADKTARKSTRTSTRKRGR